MQTSEPGPGWVEVAAGDLLLLVRGDDALRERVQGALAAQPGEDPADVVVDELTSAGVRRAPDFALVDRAGARVLVRGRAMAVVTGADGVEREVLAPARAPWSDEDLPAEASVRLADRDEPGEAEGETPTGDEPADTESGDPVPTDAPMSDAAPSDMESAEPTPSEPTPSEPTPSEPAPAASGWAMPSVFGGARPALTVVPDEGERRGSSVAPAPEPAPDAPTPDGTASPEVASPEVAAPSADPGPADPAATTGSGPDETAADPGTPDQADEEDDELPSFDFLFGNTSHHRSSLQPEEPEIDSGPVASAGGFQAPEPSSNATLAPPSEEDALAEEPAAPSGSPSEPAAEPAGLPPMPSAGGEPEQPAPHEPAPSDAGMSAPAPAAPVPGDAVSAEPVPSSQSGTSPAFDADGHLVGARVGAPASPPAERPAEPGAPADGLIAAVPWGQGAPAPEPAAPGGQDEPGQPAPAAGEAGGHPAPGPHPGHGRGTGLPTFGDPAPAPDQPGATPDQPGAAPDQPSAPAEAPVVLAVRCPSGHLSAPHATRCRVCQQELPEQEPEQTPRPALGLLRLSTGDVVELDRGVLLGRAPKAADEITGLPPHLVRVASPDNEISRNHAEIILDGWHVLVRDLGSTNGTTVALPGSSPVRVRPGDQQTIEPGTTITLADQVSMVLEVTG
ncbi:hypothetical protein GCM10027055_28680 [Janibacter alkaliphilus]|uniref:FHA domain-containing protein n=1 Tax=Janibacter alkaliphilus TaxID=1069963 RepID=A0A852X599_9MICO|nr:FHA domain-containing protein [Janibacter alkaliphilus]NYG36550.1 hypothetical protein [Janibacter alkaliphilus]